MAVPKPNILLVNCHDLGQHIGPYGVPTVHTPALDRLARSGVVFTNSFCTSPGCSPSRAALFTGRYPHSTGVMGLTHGNFFWRMNDDEEHLAQLLGAAGYRTALIGGMHEHTPGEERRLGYQHLPATGYQPANKVADATLSFLQTQRSSETPFYLCVGLFEPHRPFDYGGAVPDRETGVTIPPYIPQDSPEACAAAEEEFAALQGAIRRVDHAIGRILDGLEQSGFGDNTVVVFTADHGLAMPRAKCSLYDPGIEVPLIIRAPSWHLEPGSRRAALVSNVDVVPTLLDALGIPIPKRIQGVSAMPCLRGVNRHVRDAVFAEKTDHRTYDRDCQSRRFADRPLDDRSRPAESAVYPF
mgnify:FL=1